LLIARLQPNPQSAHVSQPATSRTARTQQHTINAQQHQQHQQLLRLPCLKHCSRSSRILSFPATPPNLMTTHTRAEKQAVPKNTELMKVCRSPTALRRAHPFHVLDWNARNSKSVAITLREVLQGELPCSIPRLLKTGTSRFGDMYWKIYGC
jgi:hypothetical protein